MIKKDFTSHKICISCGANSSNFITYKKLNSLHSLNKYNYSVVCCKSCGLLFNNPLPSFLALEEFYKESDSNKSLPNSKKAIKKIKEANKIKRLISMPFIEKNIGEIKNSTILDIGCDNGGWLSEFDKSNKLIGIETK